MTQHSDDFLAALNAVVTTHFPADRCQAFTLKLPLGHMPVKASYPFRPNARTAHETLNDALFLQQVEALFEPGQAGHTWLANSPMLTQGAQDFGIWQEEEIDPDSFNTRHITPQNSQPAFHFNINTKWNQIDAVKFNDGTLFKGQKNPILTEFKTLKTQKELKRFFHMLSAFTGEMKLWRVYYYRTTMTIRAPSREAACFIGVAVKNAKKAFKSDTYDIENAHRVFCSAVEPDHVVESYQALMKGITI